ncbi:MAG: zinc ribbon domain-containing protein [Clostridia bacterium]|nr:zinc ribbon domain-containing protein [Clostridia bacterium]
MKSIKPGRGPSKYGFVISILVAVFGLFWCIMAGIGGAWFMIPFGLIFIGVAIYQAKYQYHNATSENRYSIFDIVDSDVESDPLDKKINHKEESYTRSNLSGTTASFCPYCGKQIETDFDFCPKCGHKLPD